MFFESSKLILRKSGINKKDKKTSIFREEKHDQIDVCICCCSSHGLFRIYPIKNKRE
jgi:hypothetical protein